MSWLTTLITLVWLGAPVASIVFALANAFVAIAQDNRATEILLITVVDAATNGLGLAALSATIVVFVATATVLPSLRTRAHAERALIRVFSIGALFISPLITALGCLVLTGNSEFAFSLGAILLALSASALPVAIIVLGAHSSKAVRPYLESAAMLGAGPTVRFWLAARLLAPAVGIAFLVSFSWAYADLVATGIVGSGLSFFPGTLTSYLFRHTQVTDAAFLNVLPSAVIAGFGAFLLYRKVVVR